MNILKMFGINNLNCNDSHERETNVKLVTLTTLGHRDHFITKDHKITQLISNNEPKSKINKSKEDQELSYSNEHDQQNVYKIHYHKRQL